MVAEGYSFNYNLVDDDEQAQKPDESFSDYQIRLLGLVSTTLNSGNIRSYYNGIDGDDAKDDTRPKGHIFTLVPTLGADGQPLKKSAIDLLTPLWEQTDPAKAANPAKAVAK